MKRYKKDCLKNEITELEDLLVRQEDEVIAGNISITINEDDTINVANIEPGSGGVGMVDLTLEDLKTIAAYYIESVFV